MQVNRIQGNYSVLNQINNQIKHNSVIQNKDQMQTINCLCGYKECISFSSKCKVIDMESKLLEPYLRYFDEHVVSEVYEESVEVGLSELRKAPANIIKAVILYPLSKGNFEALTCAQHNPFYNALLKALNNQNKKPAIQILDFVDTLDPEIQAAFYALTDGCESLVEVALNFSQIDMAKEIIRRAQKLLEEYPDKNLENRVQLWKESYSEYGWCNSTQ